MATISRITLSGSTDGRPIEVAANSTAGTTIHTGPSVAADYHEIWLWACNHNTSAEVLTLEWGGVTATDDLMRTTIQPNETVLVAPGWMIKGNASTALIVKAFSTTVNKVSIVGHANLIDAA
tara:strand:- start:235 stop:600 length:366 start_codon:yes stop_codon:yes gene_type:complete